MKKALLIPLLALCAAGSGIGAGPAAAAGTPSKAAGSGTGFPAYTREQQVDSCFSTYGVENSSILDCVARDEKVKSALAKIWPDVTDKAKTACLTRPLGSYYFLDRCIKSAQKEAATAD